MAVLPVSIALAKTATGLTLAGQLYDLDRVASGAAITTGFTEIGDGQYALKLTTPDGFAGYLDVYESGVPGTVLASTPIVPGDAAAGSGARSVTVTVTDGTDPLSGARVRLTSGLQTYALTTGAPGTAAFSVDDGTWTLTVTKAGYSYAATSVTVDGVETVTAAMTADSIPVPADPTLSTAYLTTYGQHGAVMGSVPITFELTAGPGDAGYSHGAGVFTVTSNSSTGVLNTTLVRQATYRARRGDGDWVTFTVADAATYALPEVLGAP